MYINKIDELIDQTLDNFYEYFKKNPLFESIKKEYNFVKYQNEINELIKNYIDKLDKSKIESIVSDKKNVDQILDILKRYIAYYIYMTIAYFYDSKRELYVTNIVECSKNQKSSNIQINNFFNSENNAIIINFYTLIKNILTLVSLKTIDKIKLIVANNPLIYEKTIKFFNSLGQNFVEDHFITSNNMHNVIKTIIFRELYLNQEKTDVYNIINHKEKEEGEYIYIDVMISKKDTVLDYNLIEKLFSIDERKAGLVDEIYDFIVDTDQSKKSNLVSDDEKVVKLISNNIIIPISEDFLRFHKDSEKYDNNPESSSKSKEKDNTKIKYIVSKTNNLRNFYSTTIQSNNKLKFETEKLFYSPLIYRNVVLYNDFEEMKLIKKLENVGKKTSENDFLMDLLSFRNYAYQNFKDFSKEGFKVRFEKTNDVLRYVSIKDSDGSKPVQYRVGSKDMDVNIVGIAFRNSANPLQCATEKSYVDIRKINKNGVKSFNKVLEKEMFNSEKSNNIYYWLFDSSKDVIKKQEYQNISSINKQQNITLLVGEVYNKVLEIVSNRILNKVDSKKINHLTRFKKLLDNYSLKYVDIYKHQEVYNRLMNTFIDKYLIKTEEEYDNNDDIIPGQKAALVELPEYKDLGKKVNIINLDKDDSVKVVLEKDKQLTICQHYLTWDNIMKMNRRRLNDFNQAIFDFVKKYIKENEDSDYICKSCGEMVSIKKFVYEGSYDKSSDSFITTSIALDIPLEELPEYEKYQKSIKNIDKIIEKICYNSGLNYYVGSGYAIKIRRKMMVREIIDLILINNKKLKKNTDERLEKSKMYGIDKSFTNLFIFNLNDEIFVTSSKDIDQYKKIKFNNIITYIIFVLITEINLGQIMGFSYHKKCNYFLFDQYGIKLFNGLKIITNNKGDSKPITDYMLLCYVIYYVSCLLIQNNIWLFENIDKSGYNPHIHKSIIHTLVELINHVLEINTEKQKDFFYEIMATRFLVKLNSIYNDQETLQFTKEQSDKNIKVNKDTNKVSFILKKIDGIEIDGLYKEYNIETYKPIFCESETTEMNRVIRPKEENKVSYGTNCVDGNFHNWTYQKGELICQKCNKTFDPKMKDTSKSDADGITNRIKLNNLLKLTKKNCISGEIHDIDVKTEKCTKCKINPLEYKYSEKDLYQLEKNLKKIKEDNAINQFKLYEKIENEKLKQNKKDKQIIRKVEKEFKKVCKNDIVKCVDKFIDKIEDLIGKNVNIGAEDIYIRNTIYYIDHDYLGYKLKESIKLFDIDDKINLRKNDKFFKMDVLYYFDKSNSVEVFYDAISKNLLGYKEKNKEYTLNNSSDNYLVIKQSIKDKLLSLGFENEYVNLNSIDTQYSKMSQEQIESKKSKIIATLIRTRIKNLKNVIVYLQRIINGIKYSRSKEFQKDNLTELIVSYSQKIKDLKIRNKENKKGVFKNWEKIINKIFIDTNNIKTFDFTNNNININNIINMNNNDSKIIYYIIKQFERLISYNDNKSDKINIALLICNSINTIYKFYYINISRIDVKTFQYLLDSESSVIDETTHDVGFYNELVTNEEIENEEVKELVTDNNEMDNAIDMDIEDEFDDDEYLTNMDD